MRKRRLIFYILHATVVTITGVIISNFFDKPFASVLFVAISIGSHIACSPVKFIKGKYLEQGAVVLLGWVIAFVTAMTTMLHFAFDRKQNPVDLYGLTAFIATTVVYFELYLLIRYMIKDIEKDIPSKHY